MADPLWGHLSIGTEIARARQAAGLSHADLAHRTRIRSGILQAIERDDFDVCGGEVYARGHIRAIATALGVDARPWLDELGGLDSATHLAQEEPEHLDIWELRDRSKSRSEYRSWIVLVLVAVVAIAAFVYVARQNTAQPALVPTETPTQSASATPTQSTTDVAVTPTATPSATATSTGPVELPQPATGAVEFTLTCVGASWVRITNELGLIYEGTMQPGDTRDVASMTDVYVRVGNAAGMQLNYNGRFYPTLGNPGEVYSHIFRAN